MVNDTKAYLKDTQVLIEFQNSLEFFSGSAERLMDAVSDYLNDVRKEMERHISILEDILRKAEDQEEYAKQEKDDAFYEWQDAKERRQTAYYSSNSEDDNSYLNEQYYNMEAEAESRYYQAKVKYEKCIEISRRAESDLKEGKSVLTDFQICEDNYRAEYSLVNNPGGDALIRYIAKNDVKESISALNTIIETVTGYWSCPMWLGDSGHSSVGRNNYQSTDNSNEKIRREKAMENSEDKIRRNFPCERPNPNIQIRCKVCGRPFAICRCRPSILPDVK